MPAKPRDFDKRIYRSNLSPLVIVQLVSLHELRAKTSVQAAESREQLAWREPVDAGRLWQGAARRGTAPAGAQRGEGGEGGRTTCSEGSRSSY